MRYDISEEWLKGVILLLEQMPYKQSAALLNTLKNHVKEINEDIPKSETVQESQ